MKDGTVIHRIGDDGCYMTKKRIIAHQSLNVVLVWGVVVLLGHDRVCFRGASPRADIVSV